MEKTKIKGNLLGNMAFEMDINGHKLITDASPDIGGEDRGPRPKPLLLASIIGCTGIDIMTILETMRVEIEDMTIEVEASDLDEHPKIYKEIHIIYRVKADEKVHGRVERAVELSQEKYCPASATVRKATPISYEVIFE